MGALLINAYIRYKVNFLLDILYPSTYDTEPQYYDLYMSKNYVRNPLDTKMHCWLITCHVCTYVQLNVSNAN